MFLHELGSSDLRFKTLTFHEGLNLLVADKTDNSTLGDSRNGAGKSSFIRILRYVLGNDLDKSLKVQELDSHSFYAKISFDDVSENSCLIQRPIKPQTKVIFNDIELTKVDWKLQFGDYFGLPDNGDEPKIGELVGQLVRTYFLEATKIWQMESDWKIGARIGFLLGMPSEILNKAGALSALEKHRKNLKTALSEGALPNVSFDEAEIRARLAQTRAQQIKLEDSLMGFRVDVQYAEHQKEVDRLSAIIRDLNDEAIVLEQRKRDLEKAMREEQQHSSIENMQAELQTMYSEVGVVLPDVIKRRFEEVVGFHESVVNNRQHFLSSELSSTSERLSAIALERQTLDETRSGMMRLLNDTMALDTFRSAEKGLAELNAKVADLEQRYSLVQDFSISGPQLRAKMAEAETDLRVAISECSSSLDEAVVLFAQLGEEIYRDRNVSLLIDATNKGCLKVTPKIDGDASTGISEVKTFLLDMVCVIKAIELGRAPRILVHDSLLFDSMDNRQLASCLNIGARMASEHGFQYIVTINSDRLEAAESEGFRRLHSVINPVLTDSDESGGLFGFRF